jgi:FSR family fosmidomycin resistance protein-like MFS transporter
VTAQVAALVRRLVAHQRTYLGTGLMVVVGAHTLTQVFTQVHTTLFPVLQEEFSLSLYQLGLVAAIPALSQVLFSIPTGYLSDVLGSRAMLLVSMATAASGCVIASQSVSAAMLIVAVSLVYINTTTFRPAAYRLVNRLFGARDRLRALGIYGAGGTLGVAVGPLSISLLVGGLGWGWRQVYLFWLAPILVGIVAVARADFNGQAGGVEAREETATERQGVGASLWTLSAILFLVYLVLRVTANSMFRSFMSLYLVDLRGLSQSQASLYIAGNVAVGIVAAPVGGALSTGYRMKRWLIIVLAAAYACLGTAVLVPDNQLFLVLYLAHGFCRFLGFSALIAMMAELSPAGHQGLGYGWFFLSSAVAGVIAPIVGASIAEGFGLVGVMLASVLILFSSLAVLTFGVKLEASRVR